MPVVSYLPAEILDYVETHAPSEESAFGISQRELAKALGYHPSSMSRPLADLVKEGLLRTQRGIVRGGQRKQFVYALTEEGRANLRKQTQDVPLLSGALPPPPNPFLGRKEELRELMTYSQGGGAIVFVEGPSGMGKTALVSRHLRRMKAGKVPFWFTIRPGMSPRQFAVSLAHALASLGAQQLAYYSQLPRQPVGREVADLAQRALGARELITVIDDFHAAPADMRRFLQEFVEGLARGRQDLFFFLGHEPPFFGNPDLPAHHLVVGGLDRASAHELTDRRGGLADRFESVYQASLGSPLLLQLAVSTPGVEATQLALPAAVVERMPVTEQLGLLPLALANEPVPPSFLVEVGGIDMERLAQLTQAGIVQRASEGRLELLQAVRMALMTKVTPAAEREAHLKLAAFYGRSHRAESVRERFLHLAAGEAWRQAADMLVRQERILLSLGYSDSLRNALRHLGLALPKGTARVRALRAEANLLRLHSEYAEAILSLRRAVVEADRDPRVETDCLLGIVELYVRMRQIDEAERALQLAREKAPSSRRFDVYLTLSEARIVEARGDLVRAQGMFQQAFQYGKKWRVPDLALEGVAAWSRIASLGGDRDVALALVEEALPDARNSGRLDIVFNLLLVRARAYAELDQKERAEAEMRLIRVEAEALGYLNQLTYTLSGLCAMAVDGGRWAEAVAHARQAIALAERLGNDVVLGHTLALLGASEQRQGLPQDALEHAERAVTVLSRLAPSDSLVVARSYLSEAYLEVGKLKEAREQYEAALGLAESMGMTWWKDQVQKELEVKLRSTEGGGLATGATP